MRTSTIRSPFRIRGSAPAAFAASLVGLGMLSASCGVSSAFSRHGSGTRPPARILVVGGGGGGGPSPRPRPHTPGRLTGEPGSSVPVGTHPTSTEPPSTTTLPRANPGFVPGRVTVVGDSVTIDAEPALQALIPGCQVDAEVGAQWETGVQALGQLHSSGQLGSVVVVALGTNGPVSAAEFVQMMSVLQGASRVVFVTDHAPDYWEEQNNSLFKAEVPHYPVARIADWDAAASANPSWLYSDGTHMPIGGPGAYAWARLVKAQI